MEKQLTQRERVLADLTFIEGLDLGHGEGVACGSHWLQDRIPRYAARINELRNDGVRIVSGWCRTHKTATYRIER